MQMLNKWYTFVCNEKERTMSNPYNSNQNDQPTPPQPFNQPPVAPGQPQYPTQQPQNPAPAPQPAFNPYNQTQNPYPPQPEYTGQYPQQKPAKKSVWGAGGLGFIGLAVIMTIINLLRYGIEAIGSGTVYAIVALILGIVSLSRKETPKWPALVSVIVAPLFLLVFLAFALITIIGVGQIALS